VKFISRNKGYTLFLTPDGATLSLRSRPGGSFGDAKAGAGDATSVIRMKLDGARRSARVGGEGELEGKVNYIRGRDPRAWRTGVETYSRVRYRDVYRGVDLVYYGKEGDVEYDFVVAPGADPKSIRFTLEGAPVSLNAEGNLVLRAVGGALTLKKPYLYQDVGGVRREVEGGYALGEDGAVRFSVGRYDRTRPLVIDPVLSSMSFFGGESDNSYETDIAVDSQGSVYAAGSDIVYHKQSITKLNPAGTAFVYNFAVNGDAADNSTRALWYVKDIAVDAAGSAYVTGSTATASGAFPTTGGLYATRSSRSTTAASPTVRTSSPPRPAAQPTRSSRR
jgi:hypothetical protein